jgi:hypothetical protein
LVGSGLSVSVVVVGKNCDSTSFSVPMLVVGYFIYRYMQERVFIFFYY